MPRIGFDLSKAGHADGIGTWQREMARELARRAAAAEPALSLHALIPRSGNEYGATALTVNESRRALGPEADAWSWPSPARRSPPAPMDAIVSSAWWVPAGFTGRLFYTVHDLTFLTHPECHTLDNRRHCLSGLIRAATVAETRWLAISRSTAGLLGNLLKLESSDVELLYAGVSDFWRREASPEMPATADEQHLPEQFVLCVGSLEPRKNLARLLRAHQALDLDLRQTYPLVLVGGHGWKNDALLESLTNDAHCRVLGRVSRRALRTLYNLATVFVYPSLAEGFGLPVVEAMACGAPVLTSNTTSLPEVVGDAALTVDPLDQGALTEGLHRLLSRPGLRSTLAEAGLARAATFRWSVAADRLYRLLAEPPTSLLSARTRSL